MVIFMNYKLYRSLHDIIHPSISRKNISNYEIIMNDEVVPVNIFYPSINTNVYKAIIYIPDKIKKDDIYIELAKETNNLIIVINYTDKNKLNDCYKLIKYIYDNIEGTGIDKNDIAIMSDYAGTKLEEEVLQKSMETHDFSINNAIIINPNESINNSIMNKNKVLVITGIDSKVHKNDYKKINSYLSGFVRGDNLATSESIYSLINDFLG